MTDQIEAQGRAAIVLHNGSELFPVPSSTDYVNPASAADRIWVAEAGGSMVDELSSQGFSIVAFP